MRLRPLLAATAAFAAICAPAAHAQGDPYVNVPDLTTPGLNSMVLDLGTPFITGAPATGKPVSVRPQRKATRAQRRALRFRPDARRAVSIDATVAADLKTLMPAELHPKVDELIASGVLRSELDRMIRLFGGSPTNFADRFGMGVMTLWLVYDRETDDTSPFGFTSDQVKGGRRFLRRLRAEMALRRSVRRLSDARMQRQSDSVGLIGIFSGALLRAYAEAGMRAEAARLQDEIASRAAEAFDIRLSLLRLDERGFH